MKKVLFGTTALVLSAGVAAAEVSVTGKAGIWLQDNGPATDAVTATSDADTTGDIVVLYDLNISFSASGETDSGLTFGLDYTFLEDGTTDNSEVYVSGAFGKLTVGDVDDALQMAAGLADIGYDGIGIDDVAEANRGAGNADGVLYSYAAGDFAFYLSHNMDLGADDVAVGVTAGFGDFAFGLGYEDQQSIGDTLWAVDLSGSFGDASFDIFYSDADVAGTAYGIYGAYTSGATTFSAEYADNDVVTDAAYGIGIAYDLGGATLAAGVGSVASETVWDLGVSMEF